MLALGAACRAPLSPRPTPAETVRARLLRIEDTRRDEPAFIDSLLRGDDPRARAQAALTVGRLGARAHVELLRRLARQQDSAVAGHALFALGLMKDSAAISVAVAALGGGGSPAVEAAWLLGEVGARDAIVTGLGDVRLDGATRAALLLAASRLRPVPASAIVPHLGSSDSATAWRAAYALARGRSVAGLRALLDRAASPWATVREQVARGATLSLAGDSLATLARAALAPLAADTSARVRINAVRSLSSYGAVERTVVVAALRDRDAGVRLTAAQSLDLVLDSNATVLAHAIAADTSLVVQRVVANAARKRGVRLAAVSAWRESDDWQRRAVFAELVNRDAADGALPALETALRDGDGRVRAAAATALRSFADSARVRDVVRARFSRLLADPDVGVRATALSALAPGASADDLAAALVSYELARVDGDNDARLAFWTLVDSALAHPRGAIPDSIERRLATLARPADTIERLTAARLSRFAAWRDSSGSARPVEWYEARAREADSRPPVLHIETERGIIELLLYVNDAPLTVFNITTLARGGYFNGQRWHRVVPNFVVQGGDPRGDGNGGPGYAIRDELNRRRYVRGTLGMALAGPHTGGSQFFVTHSPQPHLDGGYTVFGQLGSGGDVLDAIVQGDRIVRVTIR